MRCSLPSTWSAPSTSTVPIPSLRSVQARVAALLRDAEVDVLAYLAFPLEHWRSISSTNVLERLNAEIDRRFEFAGARCGRLQTPYP